jgi:exopolyphosphatase/guanosine-5'-triphosphate,3'-diphosphate pyrophosphatase
MALLLRLAAALDRRPAAVIEAIRLHRSNAIPELEIELVAAASVPGELAVDLSLERWSLRSCGPVVLEALGLTLKVREP